MNRSKLIAYAVGAWLLVEVVAFLLVVQFLGMVAAITLGVGTTALGLLDIKRLLAYLRDRVGRSSEKKTEAASNMVDGGLQALGALLLILPGFASDLVGLALKAPSIRADIAQRIKGNARKNPRMIDLAPNEWKSLDHRKSRRRGAQAKSSGAPPYPS
ncbi:MAG: FxsA family protein [Methylocystis sp.]